MKRRKIPYSEAEMAWLEANRAMVISDYHRAFCAAFARDDVTAANLHGLRKRMGWKVGRGQGRLAGRHRLFSAEEIAWLRDNIGLPTDAWHRTFVHLFGRQDITVAQLISLRKNQKWRTGRDGQFVKGQEPPNKGKKCAPGTGGLHPNARRTQFRKGQLPHNTQGAGHERIDSKDGYVVLIVEETNPWSGASTRPVHKHRWLWEQKHGPIPDGYALKCLDGDKTNCDPSNWELIPRGMLPRLNGGPRKKRVAYDQAPTELKPTIMAVAKLEHKVRERMGK
ncbi:HNH endonuclease signature motif containing protein [Pelagibacterium lentulum]|uniref:HNH nuclease domain-containing protein n=2 Tax=Pelagibacterium lentulum TaxID=2029865 RepID=A0A916RRT0_9HYPH|nr:HNH endonuclease signature motif containing protein [Pelagibacterium lentulum]GGA63763.1 hypothetical protein GCM10011499_37670 [Pelagibacterium lentulum]